MGETGRKPRRMLGVLGAAAGVVALLVAVVGRGTSTSGGGTPTPSPTAAAGPFGNTPAAAWRDARTALVMPAAKAVGRFSATDVRAALARTRTYLLAAHTSAAVVNAHNVASLRPQLDPRFVEALRSSSQSEHFRMDATFLAPRNRLAAPVRLAGTVTDAYRPASGGVPAHLAVNLNLVWAYALAASYDVAPMGSHVVAIHEKLEIDIYPDASGHLGKPAFGAGNVLFYDSDCGYFNQSLLGLPRVNDPDALPAAADGVEPTQGFDPDAEMRSSHACKH